MPTLVCHSVKVNNRGPRALNIKHLNYLSNMKELATYYPSMANTTMMADSGRHLKTLVFDIVHAHFLRNVHVHFTTLLFLTLYMYSSCFKNVHVQLDNFFTPRLLKQVIQRPFLKLSEKNYKFKIPTVTDT